MRARTSEQIQNHDDRETTRTKTRKEQDPSGSCPSTERRTTWCKQERSTIKTRSTVTCQPVSCSETRWPRTDGSFAAWQPDIAGHQLAVLAGPLRRVVPQPVAQSTLVGGLCATDPQRLGVKRDGSSMEVGCQDAQVPADGERGS